MLFGSVSLFASLIRLLMTRPALETGLRTVGGALLDPTYKNWFEAAGLCACAVTAFFRPCWMSSTFANVERAFQAFSLHRRKAILLAGLFPILIRVALLPVMPVPQPKVADEFGHLLIADTFASGRIANPPHPMWRHFESSYILQKPVYTSIYPFAQGLLLASAKAIGCSPWLAVCLSVAAMCGAICWMLQGWLPPQWALLGALLAITRFSFLSYWMNTYWGGAVPAIGGALVVGALPRIMRLCRPRDSLLLGLGLAILAQSRPFEGFLLSLPVCATLIAWLFRTTRVRTRRVGWDVRLKRMVLPLCGAAAAIFAVTAYYNWRVTGDPLVMPYQLHQRLYGTPQSFFWSAPVFEAPGLQRHKDLLDNFHWQLKAYLTQASWQGLAGQFATKSNLFWNFSIQPLLTLPLLFLPLACKDRWTRFLVLTWLFVWVGMGLYPFFYYHYAAPVCGLTLFAMLQGMRRLRGYQWRGRPVGLSLFRFTLALVCVSFLASAIGGAMHPTAIVIASTTRSRILERLRKVAGKHLVLVRYGPEHSFHEGEIYNAADIDRSPVVWARELDAASNNALLRYYSGRKTWLLEPDEEPYRFTRLNQAEISQPALRISAILSAAGIEASREPGVTPGGIVTIFGNNFANRLRGSLTLGSIFWPLPLEIDKITMRLGNVYAPVSGVSSFDEFFSAPLPLELGNVRVQFGDRWAPIFSVANIDGEESVTVQAPFELSGTSVPVTLWLGSDSTTARNIPILPASPGILQADISEIGLTPVLRKQDGSFVADDNPAHPGEIVRMLVTGLGPVSPPVATNRRTVSGTEPAVRYPIAVWLNNAPARFISAKYAAELIGIEEVAFQVPAGTTAGLRIPVSVTVTAGSQVIASNSSTIPVR